MLNVTEGQHTGLPMDSILLLTKTECENIRKYKIRSLVYNQAMAGVKSGECLLNQMCIKQSKNCLPTVSKIKAKKLVSKKSFTSFDFSKDSIKSLNFPTNEIKEDVNVEVLSQLFASVKISNESNFNNLIHVKDGSYIQSYFYLYELIKK